MQQILQLFYLFYSFILSIFFYFKYIVDYFRDNKFFFNDIEF